MAEVEKVLEIENEQQALKAAVAGLQRFYSEGMREWSKENLLRLFHNNQDVFNSAYVQQGLEDLEFTGMIDLVKTDDIYLIVKTDQ